jgi:hypothetical protein
VALSGFEHLRNEAAYGGLVEVCELLIELGADPSLRDSEFNAPSAGWARHAHHDALAVWPREREQQYLPFSE